MDRKKVTIPNILGKKARCEPITMLTAYDYPSALLVDRAGIDLILVGDSLGMVVLGYENTLPVTMDEMIHHCKAVGRGAKYALLIGDMPFLSYQTGVEEAVANAGRFIKEAGMDAVKIEGGQEFAPVIEAMVRAGIPVMGHIGLMPQSVAKIGGFKVQDRDAAAARRLLEDAQALQEAGCFSLVLEAIPAQVAELVTAQVTIPTIGIGAGPHCDGQVLVFHDVMGLFERFTPRFVKRYAQVGKEIEAALTAYRDEVLTQTFPGPEHSFSMPAEEFQSLLEEIK